MANQEKNIVEQLEKRLSLAKENGDRSSEGAAYGNLGNAYLSLSNFKKALEFYQLHLQIAKEVSDRAGEGRVYDNLGHAYLSLGNFKKALEFYQLHLQITKEVGDRAGEGRAYGNLGNAYQYLGNLQKAIEFYQLHLQIVKEVDNRGGEGRAYGNLGIAFHLLGNFKKAKEFHQLNLQIAKEISDRAGEGHAYYNLGNAYKSLGNFQKAIEFNQLSLQIAKEVGDRAGEGSAYGSLSNAYKSLGNFQKAIEFLQLKLQMAKEVSDRAGEGGAYGSLGNAYQSLGIFQKAIEFHQLHLQIAKEVGNRAGEGSAYGSLGNAYKSLGDLKKAIEFHQLHLQIAKEVGNRAGEGSAYGSLGNAYKSLGDFQKAIEFHQQDLQVAKEISDRAAEGRAYCNLGNAYKSLGNFQKAIEFYQLDLQIAKDVGAQEGEGKTYFNLGNTYYDNGDVHKAIELYQSSVEIFNNIRASLQSEEVWRLSFRELYHGVYTRLWMALLRVGNSYEALCAAEHGRAQALMDALKMQYGLSTDLSAEPDTKETICYLLRKVSTPVAFLATVGDTVNIWFLDSGNGVVFRCGKIRGESKDEDAISIVLEAALKEIGAGVGVRCENRTLDDLSSDPPTTRQGDVQGNGSSKCADNPLQQLYDLIISPISDLLQSGELIVFPDGPLCLAPWSALSESIRIRTVPSLTSLKLLADVPVDLHSRRGALLVGDPCTKELRKSHGNSLQELPWARKEVEMIGKLLKTPPLIGNEATKAEVLNRLTSVGLVHIAAHGDKESGEIALAPNPGWKTAYPGKDRYMLKVSDVQEVRLRASLVVLSCSHSGRGMVLGSEGVVGIARAFLCAGARSVLVSLWAIDDEATMNFMNSFYQKLREGKSTSVAVHHAMKSLQDSDRFCDMKHWAPFLLIGDDVKLDFGEK